MNPGSLASDLTDQYSSSNRTPADAADLYSQAVVKFWESAIAPGGGSVAAQQVRAGLNSVLENAYSQNQPSGAAMAQVVGLALNQALLGVIISGGTYGVGPITALGGSKLIADLSSIYTSITPNHSQTAFEEAQAIWQFSTATICFGTGVESPPIPKIGPLS